MTINPFKFTVPHPLFFLVLAGFFQPLTTSAAPVAVEGRIDIAPFALPRTATGEFYFEEPRDILQIDVTFKTELPEKIGVSYLQNTWPERRVENERPFDNPCRFGWFPIDDWFNTQWKEAEIQTLQTSSKQTLVSFLPLTSEFPDLQDYDVGFRRTLGIRIEVEHPEEIAGVRIYTVSSKTRTDLQVRLDAGSPTPGESLRFEPYNADIQSLQSVSGCTLEGAVLRRTAGEKQAFRIVADHMRPDRFMTYDEGLILFDLGEEAFTISLKALAEQGPIWFEDLGVYITEANDPTPFEAYRARTEKVQTISERVQDHGEQSLAGAMAGQPAPHRVGYPLGRKYSRQRFWVEPNGDIVARRGDLEKIPGNDTARFLNRGDGAFRFDLDRWVVQGWASDPEPVLASNLTLRQADVQLEQKVFAAPLAGSRQEDRPAPDDTLVGMARFRFTNLGDRPARAELPVRYSSDSGDPEDGLSISGNLLSSTWEGAPVLRARFETSMEGALEEGQVRFTQELAPGQSCEWVLMMPYIALSSEQERAQLAGLDFDTAYRDTLSSWRASSKGARIETPEPILDTVHSAHLSHVFLTDIPMPDDPYLINTSVGTAVYGNFTNESCMIVHDLDERGLHEEARRRIELWIKYQGTVGTRGNFSDHEGVFFGAGGFEQGDTYTQHHGWVLRAIAEHYFMTGDADWLAKVSDSLIAGMEWVFRQRRETMTPLPHSRGWEYGFLPAGALEDVGDYCYWLSTNALTWRGVDRAARALAAIRHPEADRLQEEAEAYGADLRRGFDTMRRHTPLQRLRNGKWIPIYPSRLYLRGRDVGWIREILEGSVYLLISGLYPTDSRQAQWILDDFHDNRYMNPPYGYRVEDEATTWFDRGGLSIQPNLLAGLLPHLDRDEPEIFLWMFFNCWAACYRPELNGMVEHPYPFLGYSNKAHYKPSDEANATSWLRAMFVYNREGLLHLGRAVPREWFSQDRPLGITGATTPLGGVTVRYRPHPAERRIEADVTLDLRSHPEKLLLRFRTPGATPLESVQVNGNPFERFDPATGDVDLTGMDETLHVEAAY